MNEDLTPLERSIDLINTLIARSVTEKTSSYVTALDAIFAQDATLLAATNLPAMWPELREAFMRHAPTMLPSITDDSAEHLQHLFYELFNRALHGHTRAYIPAIDHLFAQHAATLANTACPQQWVLYRERLLQFPPLTGYDS